MSVIIDKDLARHERRTSAIIWLCTAALAFFLILSLIHI